MAEGVRALSGETIHAYAAVIVSKSENSQPSYEQLNWRNHGNNSTQAKQQPRHTEGYQPDAD